METPAQTPRPLLPAETGLGGFTMPPMPMASAAQQPDMSEQQPVVQGPATTGPATPKPTESISRHILDALGGANPNDNMGWAKSIIAGGLAAAANVGKAPEGAGFLYGVGKGAQGVEQIQRQKMLDERAAAQQQKENARADQELQIHMQDATVQRAMWNAQTASAIQTRQQNAARFDTLQKEDQLRVRDLEDKIQASEQDSLAVLSAAGVDITKLDHITGYDQLTSNHAKQAGAGQVFAVPNGEEHKAGEDGAGVYMVPGNIWEQPIKQPVTITTGYTIDKNGNATPQKITAQEGTKVGTLLAIAKGAQTDLAKKQDQVMKQATLQHEQAATGQEKAATAKDLAQAKQAESQTFGAGGDLTGEAFLDTLKPTQKAIVQEIGTGKMALERMSYILARNPSLVAAVAQAYPDFDSSKVQSYIQMYRDFTSGKTSVALNSGATALGHLHELEGLNTAMSHIPHTAAYTAYKNKVDTLATELAKFYGDSTIPAIDSIKSTLMSTLPGNREAAIRTQAQSMGDKIDNYEQQWKNGAPSSAYQAPMPGMSEQAKEARAALDPKYRERLVAEQGGAQKPVFASAPGKPRMMTTDGGKTWQLAPQQ